MRIERNSWSRNSPSIDDYDDDDFLVSEGTVTAVGFIGFLLAIGLYGVAIWGITEILYKQDVIDWRLEPWNGYVFAAAYLVLRSLNRVMWPKR